nr:hypothetical protein [Micromonospora sp. DSM 115978]
MGDRDLLERQAALQAEGAELLTRLDHLGPLAPTGSFVSGLMVWRDLDVMLLGGPSFGPHDTLTLLGRAVDLPDLTRFDYVDERGERSPSGDRRDERFHLKLRVGQWRVDLSIWLNDAHEHVTAYHRKLATSLTDDQRLTILRIKDVWHRRPEYPDEVSGFEIYTAVLEHDVATTHEFETWLRERVSVK